MASEPQVHRLAAFTDDPTGGNPAGVVLAEEPLDAATMQRIAADVGYSETAFLVAAGERRYDVRYFAPESEVTFCGHATIASGVLLGTRRGPGTFHLDTRSGPVLVDVGSDGDGQPVATLTSVETVVESAEETLLGPALVDLGLTTDDLDDRFPPAVAFAGARHLVLVLGSRERLARLDYAFEDLRTLMLARDLTTVALLWRENAARWHARNAFPVGGVVEDPATGAAAAAFGAYLRDGRHLVPPADFEIVQGEDMGRPSRLHVTVGPVGGIRVTGRAVPIG